MPVYVRRTFERELLQLSRVAGDDAGEVHHLGQADNAPAAQETLEVTGCQRSARRLEDRRGHARRRREVHVEREAGADVEQPVDAVRTEDIRDLMRIGDDGSRSHRQHEARELVDEQLRRLEVHVRVDEARCEVRAADIKRLVPLVFAQAGDVAVADSHVGLEPFAGEDGEDAAALDDEIGGLVSAGDGYAAGEVRHRAMSSGRTGTRDNSRPVASRNAERTAAVDTTVGGSPTPFRP